MKRIETVGIVGMGALGLLYADLITRGLGKGHVFFIADRQRCARYAGMAFSINGREVSFPVAAPDEAPACDLLIAAVKYTGLHDALDVMAPCAGPQTIIISVMNGISSEEIIAGRLGGGNILHVVAQGMDAMRFGSALRYTREGHLCIGADAPGKQEMLERLRAFLERAGIGCVVERDIRRRMWGKFMLNVGINQTCMVFGAGYGKALEKGSAEAMACISAMREVILLARCEGVDLSEKDLQGYLELIGTLDPQATPSMGQDRLNRRPSEVELFAGTVRRLAARHGLAVPANDFLYGRAKEIEAEYA